MEAVDFKLIDTAAITGQTSHKNACLQASFIIANSDKHEGMVKAWRTEALNCRITWGMLQGMNERWLEVKADVEATQ